ncbi:MAG: hypothetical protein IKM94_03940 [Alphaproteobacteria bacterium]|nr:hypothetical protein [Alphaproteobacteria bacterium]
MYDDFINQRQYIASSDKKVSDITIDMLSDTEHKFLKTIAVTIITKGEVTAADAIKATGKSPQRVRQLFSVLVDKGFLVATGRNKGRKYTFKSH